jgi:hypothetical protein
MYPTNDELASCLTLAERRSRFRWQAEVSGPGSPGVDVITPADCAPDTPDRPATEPGDRHG